MMPGLMKTRIDVPRGTDWTQPAPAHVETARAERGGRLRFLFATAENHPTHRPDVRVLFGKYAPKFGIETDLLAPGAAADAPPWDGGRLLAPERLRTGLRLALADLGQQFSLFRRCRGGYDGLIVRDKPILGVIGLAAARLARIPFIYWMSFPLAEAYLDIARTDDGSVSRLRRLYAWLRGTAGVQILYRLLIPRGDFVFVQSPLMAAQLAERGIAHSRIQPIPMGVDTEDLPAAPATEAGSDPATRDEVRAVYLGTLNMSRRSALELMVDAASLVRAEHPGFCLWIVGDSDVEDERGWLERYAQSRNADAAVRFHGWLPYDAGLALARQCTIGLSPIPRNALFDCGSPTKAVEYMAVGLPVVANDQPDQEAVLRESGAGICAELTPEGFASAINKLLDDPEAAQRMGARGQIWVRENRSYRHLAEVVSGTLHAVISSDRKSASARLS